MFAFGEKQHLKTEPCFSQSAVWADIHLRRRAVVFHEQRAQLARHLCGARSAFTANIVSGYSLTDNKGGGKKAGCTQPYQMRSLLALALNAIL